MSIRYDEKGKFFTDIVDKEAVQVIIKTDSNVIRGKIHIIPEACIKDEINRLEFFFAVTDATIYAPTGAEMYHCNFIAINRERIIWILPESELVQTASGGEA